MNKLGKIVMTMGMLLLLSVTLSSWCISTTRAAPAMPTQSLLGTARKGQSKG